MTWRKTKLDISSHNELTHKIPPVSKSKIKLARFNLTKFVRDCKHLLSGSWVGSLPLIVRGPLTLLLLMRMQKKKHRSQPASLFECPDHLSSSHTVFCLSVCRGYRKISCICLQWKHHPINATSPNEFIALKFNARAPFVEFCTVSLVMNFNIIFRLVSIYDADFVQCKVWPPFFLLKFEIDQESLKRFPFFLSCCVMLLRARRNSIEQRMRRMTKHARGTPISFPEPSLHLSSGT